MSVQAMGWVLEHYTPWVREKGDDGRERWVHAPDRAPGPIVKGAARLVLVALANHASSDELIAWPSVPTLAAEAGTSRKGAQLALRELAAAGLVRETGIHRSGTVIYQLVLGGEPGSPPWMSGANSVPAEANTTPAEGEDSSPKPLTNRKKSSGRSDPPTSSPSGSSAQRTGTQNGVADKSVCIQCDGTRFIVDIEANTARPCNCHPRYAAA